MSDLLRKVSQPSVSAPSADLLTTVTIFTNGDQDDNRTHDLSFYMNGVTQPIAENVTDSYEWTIPDLGELLGDTGEGVATIICTTKINSINIGYGTCSLVIQEPANGLGRPEVTMEVSPVNGFYLVGVNAFIENISTVKVLYTPDDGAQIKSYETIVNGEVLEGQEVKTTKFLERSGTVTITGIITDTLGRKRILKKQITVEPYSKPRFIPYGEDKKVICCRCDADGKQNRRGTNLLIRFGVKCSEVMDGEKNENFFSVQYKLNGVQAEENLLDNQYGNTQYEAILKLEPELEIQKAYRVDLVVMDAAGWTSIVTVMVPPAFASWHVPKSGRGITFGGLHDPTKVDVFDCWFTAEFEKDVYGRVLGLGKLPKLTATNSQLPGVYSVANGQANSILGIPEELPGTLRVWTSNGAADEDPVVYRIQEFICADNSASYRRSIHRETVDDEWTVESWKVNRFSEILEEE